MNVLISACFLGVDCKYNGGNNRNEDLLKLAKDSRFTLIPICPEQLGGLSTPRPPSEICEGDGKDVLQGKAKVLTKEGKDVTEAFIRGAKESLRIADFYKCEAAILKARSPSCGCGKIYDGTFSGKHKDGSGVCAQLLLDSGIPVYDEENYKDLQP